MGSLNRVVLAEDEILDIADKGVQDDGDRSEEAGKEQSLKKVNAECGEPAHVRDCIPRFSYTEILPNDHGTVTIGGNCMQTMAAGVFKAKCLAVMDEVQAKREPVLITKHGKPVARLVPVEEETKDSIFGFLKGQVTIIGDIESPIPASEWKRFK